MNPFSGQTLSYAQVAVLASQENPPIDPQIYISQNELYQVDDVQITPDPLSQDFQLDIVNQDIAELSPNLESDLTSGDVSADSALEEERNPLYSEIDKATSARDQYLEENPGADIPSSTVGDLGITLENDKQKQYQLLNKQIKEAEGRLKRTKIDIAVPETFIGDNLGAIKKKFEEAYGGYGVEFIEPTMGNTLIAKLPGSDIQLKLNTNPMGFFGSEKQLAELEENLGKLKDYKISVQTGKEVIIDGVKILNTVDDIQKSQVSGLMQSIDEGNLEAESLNSHLTGTPYELKVEFSKDEIGLGKQKGKNSFSLMYNGKVVAQETELTDAMGKSINPKDRFKQDIIQNYLAENLTKDETQTIRQSVVDLNNEWTEKITNLRVKHDENIPISIDEIGKTFVNDKILEAQLPFFLENKGLTDPEIKSILDHFKTNLQIADTKIKSKEIQISAKQTYKQQIQK